MRLTLVSLAQPAAVAAVVALVVLFGTLALLRMPLQLFPDIERPTLTVQLGWRAASPQEMESEMVEPVETLLRGMPGLEEIRSDVNAGNASVHLTFAVGSDMKAALVEALARLNRLPPLPRDATPPALRGGADFTAQTLTYYFVQQLPGTAGSIHDRQRMIEDRIVPALSAIEGVAGVDVNGAQPAELQIRVDPARAAAFGLSLPDIAAVAGRAEDVSGGLVEGGRREFSLRFAGRYQPEELGDLVLAWRDGRPVRLGDLAEVEVARPPQRFFSYQNGNPAIGLRILREDGANVLATLDRIQAVVDELRSTELAPHGLDIRQSFDSGIFIRRAIGMLTGSLGLGLALAVACLALFLRDGRATAMVAVAIPLSLLATFVVLDLAGRTLNVISLAGLAFAVGMVMDAAVVVAENVLRLRRAGMGAAAAALAGSREVAGALFASTLTTVAVFVPVLFMEDVEGQLFSDLALTVSIAVGVSLLVALTVLPAAAARWLRLPHAAATGPWARLAQGAMAASRTRRRQGVLVVALTVLPLLLAWLLLPRLDYLPPVRRAAVDAFFNVPPGMGPARVDEEIGSRLRERMAPFMRGEREPALANWYLNLWSGGGTMGVRVQDPARLGEMERLMREEIIADLPDLNGFAGQGYLFGGFGGSARAIAVHLLHVDSDALAHAALRGRELLLARFPSANVQIRPEADALSPELRLLPDDRRLAESGWRRDDLGGVVRVLGPGRWLGEHFDGDRRLPIVLRGPAPYAPEDLAGVPLATATGSVVRLGDLARIETVLAQPSLLRIDGRRSFSLSFDPPPELSLEEALAAVENDLLPELAALLPVDADLRVGGSADRLDAVVATLGGHFLLALLVLALLMAALFRSLRDSLFVLASLPLALLGGVLGLRSLGAVSAQPLDLLSMIGFVMLLGMVVNNAILLVAQTRRAEAEGAALAAALEQALTQRLRPIAIAALTGVASALPLAVNPGPGAVIYRGMAAVVVGGAALSLLFTALLVPALLRLCEAKPGPRHVPGFHPAPVA